MSKRLLIFLALLPLLAVAQVDTKDGVAVTTGTTFDGVSSGDTLDGVAVTSGGGSPQSFSDDFSGDLSDWTVIEGSHSIVGGEMRLGTASYSPNIFQYSATACDGVNQYIKFSMDAQNYPQIYFRFTDGSSPFYILAFSVSNDEITFIRTDDSTDATPDTFATRSHEISTGDETYGVTMEGTGTDVTIRVWYEPTADAPTSASLWDAGAPDLTVTENPTTPVDTGNYLGMGGAQASAGNIYLDDFFGGDIP